MKNEIDALIIKAQDGDDCAVDRIIAYVSAIEYRKIKVKVFLRHIDDAMQFIRINIWRGIKSYNPDKGIPPIAWLSFCAKRGYSDFLISMNRQKNMINSAATPLEATAYQNSNRPDPYTFNDVIPAPVDVEGEAIGNTGELYNELIKWLSNLEKQVLDLRYVGWYSSGDYAFISEKLGVHKKAIDNAMQRIRRKAALML